MFHICILCLLNIAIFNACFIFYNPLLIVNHAEIFVCTDDVSLLKVYFFYVRNQDWLDYMLCMSLVLVFCRQLGACAGPGCQMARPRTIRGLAD